MLHVGVVDDDFPAHFGELSHDDLRAAVAGIPHILLVRGAEEGDLGGVAFHADAGGSGKTDLLSRFEAPLADDDDQVGAVGVDAKENRLDNAISIDLSVQLFLPLGIYGFPWLIGIGFQIVDR